MKNGIGKLIGKNKWTNGRTVETEIIGVLKYTRSVCVEIRRINRTNNKMDIRYLYQKVLIKNMF